MASCEIEYFSGLNWKEAKNLILKRVDASMNGYEWRTNIRLWGFNEEPYVCHRFNTEYGNFHYIRTTPETYAHPTIAICETNLPLPEVKALIIGTKYFWVNTYNNVCHYHWQDNDADIYLLRAARIHLTEDHAQQWADWWKNTVVAVVKGSHENNRPKP